MWLEIDDRGPVRWLIINRPERRNAIPGNGWADLRDVFVAFDASEQRVLVVTGAGGAFCSGADLDPSDAETMADVTGRHRRMKVVASAALALHRLAKPTIAAVDGVAAGAGMNLALGCDLVVGSHRARFSEIFVRRGLTVDFGGTWLLPRVIGPQRAKELSLTGRMVEAEEALAIGLILDLVDADRLEARVTELATALAAGAPVAQRFTKQGLDRSGEMSFEESLAAEGQAQAICFGTQDVAEGIAAFLEKRSPDFTGR